MKSARDYLGIVRGMGVSPNFSLSIPYLRSSGWRIEGGRVSDGQGFIFPPIEGGEWTHEPCMVDFEGYAGPLEKAFFDYEFIYDPRSFDDLSGGGFKVFRKNVKRIRSLDPEYRPVEPLDAIGFFLDWLEEKGEVYEPEVVIRYLEDSSPWGLWDGKRLLGFNAWDYNWEFVNFRYSFAVRGAAEYLRLMFYRSQSLMVNDGGSLGSEGLERFKRKLKPKIVRRRYEHRE